MAKATVAPYAKWAENYATGMAASAEATRRMQAVAQERAQAQRAVGAANRANALKNRRCVVPGCSYVWHKGRLCRKHWKAVPMDDKVRLIMDTLDAQRRVTNKHHRRIEREMVARVQRIDPRERRP